MTDKKIIDLLKHRQTVSRLTGILKGMDRHVLVSNDFVNHKSNTFIPKYFNRIGLTVISAAQILQRQFV